MQISQLLCLLVCRYPPSVPGDIPETRLAFPVRLVFKLRQWLCPEFQSPVVNRIDIFHVDVDRSHPWRNLRRQLAGLNHEHRIADLHFNVKAAGPEFVALELHSVKGLLYEVEKL